MPDFDTRKPQGPNEPSRLRIALIANKLRTLLIATKPRMLLIANRLRNLSIASKRRTLFMANSLRGWLMANRLRSLLIGGVLLFVAVAVPVGLLIYSSGGIGDQRWKAKDANLKPLAACPGGGGGHKRAVLDDDSSGKKKIVFASGPQTTISSNGIMSDNPGHPSTGMYVINADGSGLTQLTRNTAAEFGIPNRLLDDREIESIISHDSNVVGSPEYGEYGVCSPDGKKLASVTTTTREATDDDSSAPPDDTDISVRTSAGTTDLGDPSYDYSHESSPEFSPDSEKMTFTKHTHVYVANADGSDQRILANNNMRYTASPVFSPDSEKIAFVTDTPGGPDSTDLYVVNVDGTNLTRLTHNTKRFGKGYSIQEHIHDGGILFSPDSKKIAFTLYKIVYTPSGQPDVRLPLRHDMYVVNVDGTGLTRLTHTEAQEERIITWVGG